MIKQLTKHGNSMAMVIEKPILELIGADADTPFEITTDGQALILTPLKNPEGSAAFGVALEKVNTRYARALKKLAE
ncbi:AbrB/MazE/SpoVT family DNA-binding domain-containing protein [Chlorobaculum sp. MV4-Y]|jgi:antitoxin component of MazEF toxin-antitoxin module|uniref:AbrB/MazE/SpoVT family DNA-binding domain-containing protein n=1 Tax=Chlorobaculum sp. MV4-Y TaxID=2976335 RepID=UPI0021AF129F|nr:AbrB/MazE/SpoVT family DNA-binding domain-containing protein [Chlorobaculum sp. MV4-Y]UWX57967.1 AbrB/MazE/SpoVT family DNA-binding domain-containing protein [Chlorobaculum sp. MV4-Y]